MTNPSPAFIVPRMWQFWLDFKKVFPTSKLGGFYADKRGYHNTRKRNQQKWPGDYSIRLDADQLGPDDKTAAGDLTLSDALMRLLTKRLRDSALNPKDNRLKYLREFIGTLDSKAVYCRIAGNSNGLGQGRGEDDGGRDSTHLWHIHLSWLRKYINDPMAYAAVLSVLTGETLQQWNERDEDEMTKEEFKEMLEYALPRIKIDMLNESNDERWWAGQVTGRDSASGSHWMMWSLMTSHYIRDNVLPALAQANATLSTLAGRDAATAVREEISKLTVQLAQVVKDTFPEANQETMEAAFRAVLGSVDNNPQS